MLAEIVLPAGTEKVYFRDMPALFASAIHPELPEDTPRQVTRLTKFPLTEAKKNRWCGLGTTAFSVSLSDGDRALLDITCWKTLPPLSLPIAEPEFQQYMDAFQERPKTDWELTYACENPVTNQSLSWHGTVEEYTRQIEQAVEKEQLIPRNAVTLLPQPGAFGQWLLDCFVTVGEFATFAAGLKFGVRIAESDDSLGGPAKPDQPKPSQASEPLTPIRSTGGIKWNHFPREVRKPNWNEWSNMPNVRIFEACALSIDIDPHSMTTTGNDWMVGYPTLSTYTNKCFPNKATADEFHLRQRLLWANLENREHFPSAVIHAANPSVSTTSLQELAAWAVSEVKWKDMPHQLVAMAQTPTKADDAALSTKTNSESAGAPTDLQQYWAGAAEWTDYHVLSLFAGMNPTNKEKLESGAFDHTPGFSVEKAIDDERVLFARVAEPIRRILIHTIGHTAYETVCAGKTMTPAEWLAIFDRHDLAVLVPAGLRVAVSENNAVNAAPAEPKLEGETPAQRRKNHDITRERGCRRQILEHWDAIEKLHPTGADARQVERVLKRQKDQSERMLKLKTIQNRLIDLRKEKLIP